MCKEVNIRDLAVIFVSFVLIGILFWFAKPLTLIWPMLALFALVWFVIELKYNSKDVKRVRNALLVGLFLMLFDFAFENSGTFANLWRSSGSNFVVLTVPAEVMFVCLIGGAAWALYLPKKFNVKHSALDIALFAVFGAIGEYVLMNNGLMTYYQWWTSWHALISYALTWVILHAVRYKVLPDE
ncbi:MAG: hypothetical protein ABIH99_01455 [Candidatus Micrarchaeota archaeon]